MNAPTKPPEEGKEIKIQPSRLPIPRAVAEEHKLDAGQWRVLVEQTYPSARSVEAVLMALSYCRARNLDIYKKPVHIVPMWNSQKRAYVETVWPGIAEIRTTASRTGEYAGIDEVVFGPMREREFSSDVKEDNKWVNRKRTVNFPEWASVVVYRIVKGHKSAFHAKIFWEETYATAGKGDLPNDMWTRRARGQLDKCVEAAALRKAFPEELGGVYAAEEMEGQTIEGTVVDDQPKTPKVPTPPPPVPTPEDPPSIDHDLQEPVNTVSTELEEPELPECLDRRKQDETKQAEEAPPVPDDIDDIEVVEPDEDQAPEGEKVLSWAEIVDLFEAEVETISTPVFLEETKDAFESDLDGAPDEIFTRFNSIYADALARMGASAP